MYRSKRQQPLVSSLQLSQTEQDAANGNVAKRSKSPLANGAHSRVLPSDGMLLFSSVLYPCLFRSICQSVILSLYSDVDRLWIFVGIPNFSLHFNVVVPYLCRIIPNISVFKSQ